MEGWREYKLGDILSKIIGGGTPSKSKPEYWNGNIYWCSVKDIPENKFRISTTKEKITEVGLQNSSAKIINKGNVIISTRMGLGKAFINLSDMAINQDLKALIPNNKVLPEFLLYLLLLKKEELIGLGTGATVNGIRLETLKNINVKLPSLGDQQKIAKILSAYDDLIENNLKRIKLLEEAAKLTYEEWFLRFRIDGEKLPIDPKTGLPVGWKKVKLSDVTSYVSRGISPKYVDKKEIIVLNQKCIRNNRIDFSFAKYHSKKKGVPEKKFLQFGDILINSTGTGTLGRCAQFFDRTDNITVDSHITIVRANDKLSMYFLGRTLEYHEEYLVSLGKGATNQQELSKNDLLHSIELIVPPQKIQEQFDRLANTIYRQISIYSHENKLLREARDILLPRLMTGMIDVERLEVKV